MTFYSRSLARNMTYRVCLPANSGPRKLPVVYLLHGGGGNYRDRSIYSNAGDHDPMVDRIRRLAELLQKRGYAYEFHEMPGGHDWNEWNAQISGCFGKLMETLMSDPGPHH